MFHTQSAETDNRLHGRTGKGNDMLLSGGHKDGCPGECGKGGGDAPCSLVHRRGGGEMPYFS